MTFYKFRKLTPGSSLKIVADYPEFSGLASLIEKFEPADVITVDVWTENIS